MISLLLNLFSIIVLIRVLLSWVPMKNKFSDVIYAITEPILDPIRRLLPASNGIDFSPMVLMVIIIIIERII